MIEILSGLAGSIVDKRLLYGRCIDVIKAPVQFRQKNTYGFHQNRKVKGKARWNVFSSIFGQHYRIWLKGVKLYGIE